MAPAQLAEFLKQYSSIPNTFIDEMFSFYDANADPKDFAIDLDAVAKWLKVRKGNMLQTLRLSYKDGVDYKISKVVNPSPKLADSKYGKNSYKRVTITNDCFKRLCMRSTSAQSEHVRTYFVELDDLVAKYYQQFADGIAADIRRLNTSQSKQSRSQSQPGYVFVIQSSHGLVKLARNTNLLEKLKNHKTSAEDNVLVRYTFRTDHIDRVEECVKLFVHDKSLRRYKGFYEMDVDIVKKIIHGCDEMQGLLKRHIHNKADINRYNKESNGLYYLVVNKDV